MKKKVVPTIIYAINLILLSFPWITIGENGYNTFQFVYTLFSRGLEYIAEEAGMAGMDLTQFQLGVRVQAIALTGYLVFSIIYIIVFWSRERKRFNYVTVLLAIIMTMIETYTGLGICFFCQDIMRTGVILLCVLVLTLIEWPISTLMEHWDEAMVESKRIELEDKAWKKEVKERLAFEGKYSKSFYRIIWKNFKRNWRDYILLIFCNAIVFTFMIMGFGIQQILAVGNSNEGVGVFSSLNEILVNAMIPMGIIAVFIIILLIFYYLKCRASSFGILLTLGMRRKTLYYFVAIEFVTGLLLALVLGAALGTVCLYTFLNYSENILEIPLSLAGIGYRPYMKASGTLLLMSIVSLMAARDIFIDFNVGKSTDLRAIGEKLPGRFWKIFLLTGLAVCVFCMFQYGKIYNHENELLIFGLFAGIFILFRKGIARYLIRERKNKKYLKKLLLHNQLYHKSMTNTGYIVVFSIIHFCVLFYFAFQIISAATAEDTDTLFPYDIVCLAQENDREFLKEIDEKYEVEMQEYPMVRVTAYDSTEEFDYTPPQGQHIGISESTFHKLKHYIDSGYEEIPLNLSNTGEDIYIVHQQDKSVKAQAIEYFSFVHKPLLHIGQPSRAVDILGVGRGKDVGYKHYEIAGEEFGSLIGAFRQGLRENIVVFSDEFFEEIKEEWKTTHIYYGSPIENEEERIEGVTINQGITTLVLINVADKDRAELLNEMKVFEEKHRKEEAELYTWPQMQGIYDLSVSYHYEKAEAAHNFQTERIMKISMNALVIVLFLIMNFLLLAIKVLSEKELNQKRVEFLVCMGMREKEIRSLLKKELLRYYHFLPFTVALIFAIIFTVVVFYVRMYAFNDIRQYLEVAVPLWIGYGCFTTLVTYCISWSNIYHLRTK